MTTDAPPKQRKRKKEKVVPIDRRRIVADCQVGDIIILRDGSKVIVTAWINGGPSGRAIDSNGCHGELMTLSATAAMTRLDGRR